MAFEVNRRDFMKGAAAVAVSVMASGLLTGCSGKTDEVPANQAKVGDFTVSVTMDKNDVEMLTKGDEIISCTAVPKVNISYAGDGALILSFKDIFSATIDETSLKLENGSDHVATTNYEALNGIASRFQTYSPKFSFTDRSLYMNFTSKKSTMKLAVKLFEKTAVFSVKYDGTVTVDSVS